MAASALLLLLAQPLVSTARASREGADLRDLEGVRAVLSALQPGVAVHFSFGPSPFADPMSIGGHELSSSYGSGNVSLLCSASLPSETLYPSVTYLAYIGASEVEVVQAG